MVSDLMAAPLSLPRLSLGTNRVVYTDSSPSADKDSAVHEVTITHRWQESDNIRPTDPPAEPLFPKSGSLVRASTFSFQWPPSEGADRYHLQVSRRADMKLPYRPAFDAVVDRPDHGSPYAGMFSPDTDYFWRVRARNKQGVWSRWSDVWNFRWEGPRVAIYLRHHIQPNGEITISWLPNPRGSAVHHYDVYGSDERGFSVSKTRYDVKGIGRQEANVLRQTNSTEMLVVSPTADNPNMNRCYYRVVAVDQHGVESGSSDYVELPHPYVYSPREANALVGKDFRLQLKTLRSIGDLQHRYADQSQQYWEREEYEFELVQGPDWLQLDSRRGILTGTPQAGDAGTFDIEIVAKRLYPHEVPTSAERGQLFQKTAPRFQATQRRLISLRVSS